MFKMGSADKKTRKKRTRKITKPNSSPSSGTVQTAQSSLPSFLPDLKPQKSEQEEIQDIQRKMDADSEGNSPMPTVTKSSNPYLGGSCLFCHCKRTEKSVDSENILEGNQLQLWVCSNCRKTVDEEDKRNATMASLLISMEQDLKLEPPSIPPLEPITSPSNSPTSSSEPTTPNGSVCNCEACTERRLIEKEQEQETAILKEVWHDLGHAVRYVYREAGTGISQAAATGEGEGGHGGTGLPDPDKMKEHVHRLCMRDPHHLFQQLECQGRDYVIEMKVRLLKQLTAGHKTPPQAKQFVAMLLEEYKNLCTAASTLASYLTELMEHLKRFNLTWELHNKHLFQSIIYTDPVVQNSLPMLMTQLRLGAASKEAYHEDTYPNILHRYLKFDDEMSVICVVWRDCEQLLENYNDEQTAIKAKQKMMKEDLDFFMAQRKLLEENVLKNMPVSAAASNTSSSSAAPVSHSAHHTKHDTAHSLEVQFNERMKSILQGNRPSEEQSLCPNCKRKVCPCDECSINHTVFCGIINPEVAEQMPIHSSGYPHDLSRYSINVKAPSMSSISSSSGSESPITVDPERLSFPFNETFDLEDDIQEDIDDKISDSPDSDDDDETSTDEFEEDTGSSGGGGEKHSGKVTAGELSCKTSGGSSSRRGKQDARGERQQGDGEEERLVVSSIFVPGSNTSEANAPQEMPCDCTHCAQASLLQKQAAAVGEDASLPGSSSVVVTQPCQCHACLMQSGQSLPTSLPQHLPNAPRPAALHLYPHIHGSHATHPGLQQPPATHEAHQGQFQSVLRPHVYELHGMHHNNATTHTSESYKSFTTTTTNLHTNKAQQQQPLLQTAGSSGFNFDLNSHQDMYNAFDWDSAASFENAAKLNMFGAAGHKYTGSHVTSELLNGPTPPLLTGNPFLKELTGGSGVDNSLANLMKTSTVLQHCVSAAKPLTSTTVTTSTGIMTSIQGFGEGNASLQSAFIDTQNKISKVSKALLNQQQQNNSSKPNNNYNPNPHHPASSSPPQMLMNSQNLQTATPATSSTFTFGLPSPLNKNLASPLGLFNSVAAAAVANASCHSNSTSPTSSLSSLASSASPPTSSTPGSCPSSFSLTNAVTSPPSEFCFKQTNSCSPSSQPGTFTSCLSSSASSSPNSNVSSSSNPPTTPTTTSHQLKLNPDFIRAAAALQKNRSEQNAARQHQQQQQQNHSIPGMNSLHAATNLGNNYPVFPNLNLQNFTAAAGLPPPQQQSNLLACTRQFFPNSGSGSGGGSIGNPIMQLAGGASTLPALSMSTPNATPVGLATSGLKLTNNQFLPSHTHNHNNHMTLPTQPVLSSSSPPTTSSINMSHQQGAAGTIPPPQGSNNNISVGTSTPTCNDPECEGHHDNDNDSIDDSCSEQSSSTSASNQKDGKYCDCCYCEFFGHTTPPTVPISKNYPEMRERLRKRLKIKNEKKKGGPLNVNPDCPMAEKLLAEKMKKEEAQVLTIEEPPEPCLDPLEQKGLDELVRFINGSTLDEQKKSSKAAKRARQKQRKAEERATKEAEALARQAAEEVIRRQQQLQQAARHKAKEKAKKEQQINATKATTDNCNKKKGGEVTDNASSVNASIVNGTNSKKRGKHKGDKEAPLGQDPSLNPSSVDSNIEKKSHQGISKSMSDRHESSTRRSVPASDNDRMCINTKKTEATSHTNHTKKTDEMAKLVGKGGSAQVTMATKAANVRGSPNEVNLQQKGGKLMNIEHVMNQVLSNQHLQQQQQNCKESPQSTTSQLNQKNERKNDVISSSKANSSLNHHLEKKVQIQLNGDINMNNKVGPAGKTNGKKGKAMPSSSPRPGSSTATQGEATATTKLNSGKANGSILPQHSQSNTVVHQNNQSANQSNAGKSPAATSTQSQQQARVNLQIADSIKQAAQKVIQQQQGQANNINKSTASQLPQQVVNAVLNKAAAAASASSSGGKGLSSAVFNNPPLPPGAPPNSSSQGAPTTTQNTSQKNLHVSPRPGMPLNRPILHATRTLKEGGRKSSSQQQQPPQGGGSSGSSGPSQMVSPQPPSSQNVLQNGLVGSGSSQSLITPAVRSIISSSSAPSTPDQAHLRHGSQTTHQDIQPSSQTATQLDFQQRSVPSTPTKQPPPPQPSMAAAQGKSRSEGQLNWASKKDEHASAGKNKKKSKKNNKPGETATSVDEIFLPKEDQEHTEMDEFERELEEFKRFCLDSKPPPRREKLQVNVNLKDIFAKKKSGLGCA